MISLHVFHLFSLELIKLCLKLVEVLVETANLFSEPLHLLSAIARHHRLRLVLKLSLDHLLQVRQEVFLEFWLLGWHDCFASFVRLSLSRGEFMPGDTALRRSQQHLCWLRKLRFTGGEISVGERCLGVLLVSAARRFRSVVVGSQRGELGILAEVLVSS